VQQEVLRLVAGATGGSPDLHTAIMAAGLDSLGEHMIGKLLTSHCNAFDEVTTFCTRHCPLQRCALIPGSQRRA
jgi:hypothetical protein